MYYKIITGKLKDVEKFNSEVDCYLDNGWKLKKSGVINSPFLIKNSVMIAELIKEDPNIVEVKVKYFDPELPKLNKISVGDWIDLRAAERVELLAGEYYCIYLGVGMILPDGYEAHVLPRSSTPAKFGIICANSMSVIDNSYSGDGDEWRFPALAIRDTVIEKGDRIAQFRIMKNQPRIIFDEVVHLNETSRGGLGSTGMR